MTMVLPCRLITRQRSHMGLTDALTFIGVLSVSVGDAAAREVVWREFDLHLVPGQDADVVLAHLSGDRGQHRMPPIELHPKHRARERFGDLSFHLDLLFFACHRLSCCLRAKTRRGGPPRTDYGTKTALFRGFAPGRIRRGPPPGPPPRGSERTGPGAAAGRDR